MNSNNNRFIAMLVAILAVIGGYYYFTSNTSVDKLFSQFTDTSNPNSIAAQVNKSLNDSGVRDTVNGIASSTSGDSAKTILNKKLNAYVDLLNYVNEGVLSSYDRYDLWADVENGPTGKERNIYGMYELADYSNYFETADEASTLEPKIPLDAVYLDYKAKYDNLKPKADEAYKYYDQEDYKDDGMAKGKAMNKDLVAAFEDFLVAGDTLSSEYEKIDLVERQKELEEYKNSDREVAYSATNVLVEGQDVYIFMRDQLAANGNDVTKVSADEFKKQQDAFELAVKDLKDVAVAKESEIESEYGITGDSLMDQYISSSEDYLKSMKSIYRSLRDKTYVERDSFSQMTDGTPENLVYEYNDMVDRYNFMSKF